MQDIAERHKQIKHQGGYAITHIGDLRRRDGKLFSTDDAHDIVEFLHWFFSFTNGARCGCVLNSGLRYLNYPLWEQWSPHITSPSNKGMSWFARDFPDQCLSIANNVYSFWQDKDKREWLKLAISIYTESNRNTSGTDIELTKAQIALELLCWVVLREENTIISEEGLDKLPTVDRVRLLLSWCGIPLPIPSYLNDLISAFKIPMIADGPQAITEIRNSVVHPTKKSRDKLHSLSNIVKYEAWQLSIWYIELVLLKLFGYSGKYNNRLDRLSWAGTYEPVPWVP